MSHYTFDSQGRLTQDQDAAGNAKTLSESDAVNIGLVTLRTPSGVQTQLSTQMDLQGNLLRDDSIRGFDELFRRTPGGSTTVIGLDSTKTVTTDTPDPRFGMLAPVQTVSITTPLGLITSTTTTSRSITTSGGSLATFLEQTNLNGHSWQKLFNASTRTWTTTSPAGRTQTMTLDADGRAIQMAFPEVPPFTFTYDAHGHLVATSHGSRTWTQGYDAHGYLASTTDPLGDTITFTNDALGRPTTTALADARTLSTAYDGDGNTTQIVLPSTNAHDFAFTPVNLMSSYTPPSLGSGSFATTYGYDADRRLSNVTHPDGASASYTYDSRTGLLSTVTIPQGTLSYGYDSNTGYLDSIRRPDGVDVQYSFDGFLRTKLHWSGFDAVSFGYDSNFRVVTETAASSAISLGYDLDGLLTGAGSITISRDASNGRITGTTLGSISDSTTYDANGLFATYGAQYSGNTLYAESVQRDLDDRITQKTETVQGTTHVWAYTYDANGRLTHVSEDGGPSNVYAYDADDNRTSFTSAAGPTTTATYDAQDRLLTYGSATYTYNANGDLATKTDGAGTTTYTYDVFGNLLTVALPSGSTVTYLVDGENRRLARELNGTTTSEYLYKNALNVVAQLDGNGNLVTRYVFGSKRNVPDYLVDTNGNKYRLLSDHLGSLRLVVNAATGMVAEEIDYDEFGNVTSDTSPGLTPFGFAGGLYDAATGLARFGVRDYDAGVGRWTSKDPIRFKGGMNLYGYVVNDPVNSLDTDGQLPDAACIDYLSRTCTAACEKNAPGRPDCWFWCMLGVVGAAIADPEYCIEPTTFEAICIPSCTASELTCNGADNSGNFYACLRSCMLSNNCQY